MLGDIALHFRGPRLLRIQKKNNFATLVPVASQDDEQINFFLISCISRRRKLFLCVQVWLEWSLGVDWHQGY